MKWRLRLLLARLQITAEYKHRVEQIAAGGGLGSEGDEGLLRIETLRQVEAGRRRRGLALDNPRPRADSCSRLEGPDLSNSAATKQASNTASQASVSKRTLAAAAGDPDVLKTVQVSMGTLGDFIVKVYTDAFQITNLNDGIKMEISNVGRPVVMVKETVHSSIPRVLTADSSRSSVDRCTVRVSRRKKKTGFSVGLIWER